MTDIFSLLTGLSGGHHSLYRTDINGLIVSTVDTSDLGLETAIIDDTGAHPVERYSSEDEAKQGHEKWVIKIKQGLSEITELGYGDLVSSTKITLIKIR